MGVLACSMDHSKHGWSFCGVACLSVGPFNMCTCFLLHTTSPLCTSCPSLLFLLPTLPPANARLSVCGQGRQFLSQDWTGQVWCVGSFPTFLPYFAFWFRFGFLGLSPEGSRVIFSLCVFLWFGQEDWRMGCLYFPLLSLFPPTSVQTGRISHILSLCPIFSTTQAHHYSLCLSIQTCPFPCSASPHCYPTHRSMPATACCWDVSLFPSPRLKKRRTFPCFFY